MKARILYIGILDKKQRVHAVSFSEGVNIVTGRSSTGKSALIEIFDYCFGSSEFTVPEGVITQSAEIYFTAMVVNKSTLMLGRRPREGRAFLKEDASYSDAACLDRITAGDFSDEYFSPLDDFKKELKRYFGVQVTDVDEDEEAVNWRTRKSSTPSVRSFTSYMLQHQNLVANKHAIFYRFDQKAKRDQAIDHMKVFLGFADQGYFLKAQDLNKLTTEYKQLERAIPRRKEVMSDLQHKLNDLLFEYEVIAGVKLEIEASSSMHRPALVLDQIKFMKVVPVEESDRHAQLREELLEQKASLIGALRRKQQELSLIESSIKFANQYASMGEAVSLPESAELHASVCPFCGSESGDVEEHANELSQAILWLNSELSRSSYRLDSFEERRRDVQGEIKVVKEALEHCREKLLACESKIDDIENRRTLYEQAVEAKLRIENVLSEIVTAQKKGADDRLTELKKQIDAIRADLKENYDIQSKMAHAEKRIKEILQEYAGRFDFEDSYRPIRLRFSLETFDLWHESDDGRAVYLRSMGSGANWLSCHIVLFLSLHRYFCEIGADCSIPPILFFDQPSQVYFPSNLDGESEFSADEIASKDSSRDRKRSVDEDVKAVTNLFAQLVAYCRETEVKTGIMPQIIVTDHADHLDLPGDVAFESLVRKRWRKDGEGFIQLDTIM